jgi:hypothetical protein
VIAIDPAKKLHECAAGALWRETELIVWIRSPRTGNRIYLSNLQQMRLNTVNRGASDKLKNVNANRTSLVYLTLSEMRSIVEMSQYEPRGLLRRPRRF